MDTFIVYTTINDIYSTTNSWSISKQRPREVQMADNDETDPPIGKR